MSVTSERGWAAVNGRWRRMFFVALLAILAFLAITVLACGDDDDENGGAAETPEEVTGEEAQVEISANNTAFDRDTITVPAGSQVVVEFTNEEALPHNVAFYESGQASPPEATGEIFQGETITGPDETTTYEFDAPDEPGTYFFRCDVHPTQMTGDFVVE